MAPLLAHRRALCDRKGRKNNIQSTPQPLAPLPFPPSPPPSAVKLKNAITTRRGGGGGGTTTATAVAVAPQPRAVLHLLDLVVAQGGLWRKPTLSPKLSGRPSASAIFSKASL